MSRIVNIEVSWRTKSMPVFELFANRKDLVLYGRDIKEFMEGR